MVETDTRRLLAALAGGGSAEDPDRCAATAPTDYRDRIDRAIAATEDLDAATAFLAENDLEDLESAIERAERDVSSRVGAGREAFERLREFRRVATGANVRAPSMDNRIE